MAKKNLSLSLNTPSLGRSFKKIVRPLAVHHAVIASLILLCIIIATILNINTILSMPEDADYYAEKQRSAVTTSFTREQNTIDQIIKLRTSDDGTLPTLPQGVRINPFNN